MWPLCLSRSFSLRLSVRSLHYSYTHSCQFSASVLASLIFCAINSLISFPTSRAPRLFSGAFAFANQATTGLLRPCRPCLEHVTQSDSCKEDLRNRCPWYQVLGLVRCHQDDQWNRPEAVAEKMGESLKEAVTQNEAVIPAGTAEVCFR